MYFVLHCCRLSNSLSERASPFLSCSNLPVCLTSGKHTLPCWDNHVQARLLLAPRACDRFKLMLYTVQASKPGQTTLSITSDDYWGVFWKRSCCSLIMYMEGLHGFFHRAGQLLSVLRHVSCFAAIHECAAWLVSAPWRGLHFISTLQNIHVEIPFLKWNAELLQLLQHFNSGNVLFKPALN